MISNHTVTIGHIADGEFAQQKLFMVEILIALLLCHQQQVVEQQQHSLRFFLNPNVNKMREDKNIENKC